jgi:hypothetical protein
MSPQEARRLVGHSDIAADLRREIKAGYEFANEPLMEDAADEIDRLRTALRSVRACTDPAWAAQIIRDALREGEGT